MYEKRNNYVLVLDWFDENLKWYQMSAPQVYIFGNAEDALEEAHKINTFTATYVYYNKPKNVYLYKVQDGQAYSDDKQYLCAWTDLTYSTIQLRDKHFINL